MGTTRPNVYGGFVSVSNSQSLAGLDITGMPPGTLVWNEDVGKFFKLSVCARRSIELDPGDTYDTGVWTFANGDFTEDDVGDTLVIQFSGLNSGYNGNYLITAVNSATEIEALPAPSDASAFPFEGAATVVDTGPSEADVTVAVQGGAVFGVVWRLFDALVGVATVTGDGIDDSDPENPVFSITDALQTSDFRSTALVAPATSISVAGLTGNADGDYRVYFNLIPAASTGVITMQFNDADTNLYSFLSSQSAGDVITPSHSTSSCVLAAGGGIGEFIHGWITVRSKTGTGYRTGEAVIFVGNGPGANRITYTYTDTVTEVIKISLVAQNATTLDVGSFMTVRKLHNRY